MNQNSSLFSAPTPALAELHIRTRQELRVNPDADSVTHRRCWIGGDEHTYPVPKKRANKWAGAEHAHLTRAEILEALVYNGAPVNAATFRSRIHRGRLTPPEHRRNGTNSWIGRAISLHASTSHLAEVDRHGDRR